MLRGSNLCKSYAGRKITDDVTLELEPGKICVIIGPSGSGKTTLLKQLALLDYPDSGTIEVDTNTYKFPIANKEHIKPPWPLLTVVFQQLFLWPHLTLLQNMTLPQAARGHDPDSNEIQELIQLFEMEKFIYRYPNECSLGERQRAALVRALLLHPKYILLDEITSSLDVEQVAVILTHLKQLSQRGIGILTVTHLLHFAREAADSIIFMDDGRVLEAGGREVLENPQHERVRKFLSMVESAR